MSLYIVRLSVPNGTQIDAPVSERIEKLASPIIGHITVIQLAAAAPAIQTTGIRILSGATKIAPSPQSSVDWITCGANKIDWEDEVKVEGAFVVEGYNTSGATQVYVVFVETKNIRLDTTLLELAGQMKWLGSQVQLLHEVIKASAPKK